MPDGLLGGLRAFSLRGQATEAFEQDGLVYLINEYWTAGQRQAHSLHEISYRACFKPQLPEFFIERLTAPGETVYDPFSGRGTTALQAALMGRRPAANDVNPLSAMLAEPRMTPPALAQVAARLAALGLDSAARVESGDLLTFFHPATLGQITALRRYLLGRGLAGPLDAVDRWIRMVALNRLTGHSPGFFSVYTLPPNQAASVASQQRINATRGQVPPPRDVAKLILRKSQALLQDGLPPAHPPALLTTGPAERTPALADGAVALVVTSPPFVDIVDYEGDNWLRCWFAGIDSGTVAIAKHRGVAAWQDFVRRTLTELARVVRPGGHVAFEVGEVRNGKLLLERQVIAAAAGLPFETLGVMVNAQRFTKTANCWGVENNAGGTNTNRIVLMKRQ